ncbi:hypothetical protein HAX54_046102 [Datura stramonium]|uniref:Uncharacterized protein n=1 Tax=Datura stramonium TaxID=4076 RepID=A0ABS8WKA5_DATST|nr:hypothetical protein [Datura stramonium]
MDSKKHEIMFQVENESISFKAGRGHLLPMGVDDICMVNAERNEEKRANHIFTSSPKKKKAKFKWVKQYLYGSKDRKWVRKSRPKKTHHVLDSGILCCVITLNQVLLGRQPKGCYPIRSIHIVPQC